MFLENLDTTQYLALALVIGIPLALLRPYWALIFATFLLTIEDNATLAQSRSAILGPYFNALDALLLVALVSMVVDSVRTQPIIIPRPVILILVILLIATIQSVHEFGPSYYTMRALRWALSFPLFFVVAANMVTDESRSRRLVLSLFLGTVIAALSSLLVQSRIASYYAYGAIALIRSPRLAGVPSSFVLAMPLATLPARRIVRWLYWVSGGLFLSVIALTFTRSIWIGMIVALPILLLMFRVRTRRALPHPLKTLLFLLFIVVAASVVFTLVLPELNIVSALRQRIDTMIYEDLRSKATFDRRNALRYELDAWRSGTLILGRGLSYFQSKYTVGTQVPIAYNHLGYITYLAQLGLVGLLIYGVYLPLSVIRNSRRVWLNSQGEATRFLGLLVGSTFVHLSIVFLASGSLLSHAPVSGLLGGAVWAVSRQQALSGTFGERHTSDNTK